MFTRCRKSYTIVCHTLAITAVIFTLIGVAVADGPRKLVLNPYENVNWDTYQQHKANLHTHTNQSDGRMDPAVVIQKYRDLGYDILALTDHNRCTWPWSKHDPNGSHEGMLPIAGNELSRHHHAQSLFCQFNTSSRRLEEAIQGVGDHGGLSILNHPAMHWCLNGVKKSPPSAVEVKLVPALRQISRGDFTVEAWFRTNSAGRNILMGNYEAGATGHLNLELHTDNRVRVFVAGKKVTDLNVPADKLGINVHDGKWHHLAGVRQGKTVSIYLDGKLAGTMPDVAGPYDLQGSTYFIGRDTRTDTTSFEGDLDNVRLWTRALSPQEIGAMSKGEMPGKKSGIATYGLLAQYTFECDANKTVPAGATVTGSIGDSAGHSKGPFHAKPTPRTAPTVIDDPAPSLQRSGVSRTAFRFTQKTKPKTSNETLEDLIPEEITQRYAKLMESYPHLIGDGSPQRHTAAFGIPFRSRTLGLAAEAFYALASSVGVRQR